jgi:hypothetical protein
MAGLRHGNGASARRSAAPTSRTSRTCVRALSGPAVLWGTPAAWPVVGHARAAGRAPPLSQPLNDLQPFRVGCTGPRGDLRGGTHAARAQAIRLVEAAEPDAGRGDIRQAGALSEKQGSSAGLPKGRSAAFPPATRGSAAAAALLPLARRHLSTGSGIAVRQTGGIICGYVSAQRCRKRPQAVALLGAWRRAVAWHAMRRVRAAWNFQQAGWFTFQLVHLRVEYPCRAVAT